MDVPQNISKENVGKEIQAEAVLYDVLNKIFENLSMQMLQRVALVCKSWQQAANVEISRRSSIDCLILPLTYDDESDTDESDDDYDEEKNFYKWHVSASLKCIPNLGLIFMNGKGPSRSYNDPPGSCYRYNKMNLCGKYYAHLAISCALAVSMDNTELNGLDNKTAGILIPSTLSLKINIFRADHSDMMLHGIKNTFPELAEKAIESLNIEEEHNCFIILSTLPDTFIRNDGGYSRSYLFAFLDCLKKRCKSGTYSLWGGEFSDITTDVDGHDPSLLPWSIIIKLSGSAINSWSIVLNTNLSTVESENKLLNLRKSIKYKRYTHALALVPSSDEESFQQRIAKTEVFKKVFPEVPLIGIYDSEGFVHIGVDSTNSDGVPVFHENSIAFLIITSG